MTDPRYPVGPFRPSDTLSAQEREAAILAIAAVPAALRVSVAGLSEEQLDTPYREGGWTVRQLVHHVADSHLNSFIRFKLGKTEDNPEIRPYDQDAWAADPDSTSGEVEMSLGLIDHLHERWVQYLRSFADEDWGRPLRHPEFDDPLTLEFLLQLYAWHGAHHVGHITALRSRMGW